MDLDKICYKNTPLKRVIIKIDFLEKVEKLNEVLPRELIEVIKKSFPIIEPRDVIASELQISNEKITQNNTNTKEWHFHTLERNASLVIKENSFAIQINNYISFQSIMEVILEIKNIFFTHFNGLMSRRIGLRYINEIKINEPNPFDWTKYINENLLSIFKATPNPENITRAFHNLELRYDDVLLKFQYGLHNPDYPAVIKKKVFILDLDASYSGILSQHEIDGYLNKQHQIIQNQFEFSITQSLRDYFNPTEL